MKRAVVVMLACSFGSCVGGDERFVVGAGLLEVSLVVVGGCEVGI